MPSMEMFYKSSHLQDSVSKYHTYIPLLVNKFQIINLLSLPWRLSKFVTLRSKVVHSSTWVSQTFANTSIFSNDILLEGCPDKIFAEAII